MNGRAQSLIMSKQTIISLSAVLLSPGVSLVAAAFTGFIAFPSVPLVLLSGCVGLSSVASIIFTIRDARSRKTLSADMQGPLTQVSSNLVRGLSSFASGDMRLKLEASYAAPVSPEGKALASVLASAIADFNSITNVPLKRVCFTGANSYQEGKVAGQRIAEMLDGKGSVACIVPMLNQVNHLLRMKGCFDFLATSCPGIAAIGVFESSGIPETAGVLCAGLLSKYPELSLVYVTDGNTSPAIAESISKGPRPGVKLVVFDAVPENIALMKKGRINGIIEQNPFAQSYNALVYLYNACEVSWKPLSKKLFMDPIYVDASNYGTYWDDDNNIRIMREAELSLLVAPERRHTEKRYKFGFLLPFFDGFFRGLLNGAEAAKKLLESRNVEVEILNLYHTQEDFGSAALYNPAIESMVKRGFDGFVTGVIDPAIMPAINAAVNAGLKVTTFSTEPSSFREIVVTMIENVELLADSSQSLAASAEESSRTNTQIGTVINGIKSDISEQKHRIDANDTELASLNVMLADVQTSLSQYSALVGKMTGESAAGSRSIDSTYRETQGLKLAIDSIGAELLEFNEKLKKVRDFAGVIENLAQNTNVLAINASIQAARAGTAGKAFAVVAGEVRSLAENSGHTAESIRDIVSDITRNMDRILAVSVQGTAQVSSNLDQTLQARKSFESIASVLSEANASIESIGHSVGGIVNSGTSVKVNMDVIEKMSNTSVNRLEEISVSIAELALQAGQLSGTANDLRLMAINQDTVFSQLSVKETVGKKG